MVATAVERYGRLDVLVANAGVIPLVEMDLDLSDRIRSEMARALYHFDPNDDENYDIVINTASVTISFADLERFLASRGNSVRYVHL